MSCCVGDKLSLSHFTPAIPCKILSHIIFILILFACSRQRIVVSQEGLPSTSSARSLQEIPVIHYILPTFLIYNFPMRIFIKTFTFLQTFAFTSSASCWQAIRYIWFFFTLDFLIRHLRFSLYHIEEFHFFLLQCYSIVIVEVLRGISVRCKFWLRFQSCGRQVVFDKLHCSNSPLDLCGNTYLLVTKTKTMLLQKHCR